VSGDTSLADDIVQGAYLRMLQSRAGTFDAGGRRAYLFRIATNLLSDHGRKIQKEQREFDIDPDELPQETNDSNNALPTPVGTAFECLSDQQRALIWLAYVERYEHRDIAAMLELSEGSVRVLLFRARRRLANILKQMGEDPKGSL
jgi:RNA polymerase sigma-70 factor (ECF subfamily)